MIDSTLSVAFYSYMLPPLAVATSLGAIRFIEILSVPPVGADLALRLTRPMRLRE